MKILVVDDERLLVKGIKFNLENEGYTVDAGYDGEDAVNMARTGEYKHDFAPQLGAIRIVRFLFSRYSSQSLSLHSRIIPSR